MNESQKLRAALSVLTGMSDGICSAKLLAVPGCSQNCSEHCCAMPQLNRWSEE